MKIYIPSLIIISLFFACDDQQSKTKQEDHLVPDMSIPTSMTDMQVGITIDMQVGATTPRKLRRMTLDQLARTIPLVTNGIKWTEDFGQGEVDILALLSPTFGAPDYLNITEENLEPSLLISKFLNDASKRVCLKRLNKEEELYRQWQTLNPIPSTEADFERAEVKEILDQQVLVKGDFYLNDESHIKAQLQRLILLFLGENLDQNHPRFNHYWTLFQMVQQSSPQQQIYWAYFSVCVGLFNDPDFILY
jgi:hypothetical protein